ncbi:hypothetical protein M514_01708, partial [Trichuris suis]
MLGLTIALGSDLSLRRLSGIVAASSRVQTRCFTDAENPYVVPKNRFVRLWRRFQLRHPHFYMGCIVGACCLFLFSPYIMHTLNALKMTKEEYNAYREGIYQRNVNRGRFGEGLVLPFYTFDLFSKETIKKEKELHEQRVLQLKAEAEKRAERKKRAKESQED